MSRQNKQKRVKELRVQVTAVHTKAVESTGLKRTMQPVTGRAGMGFTKKLTSARKGKMGATQPKGNS